MIKGIVIGKFYPPHKGHKYLIDTAKSQVDNLTVIVCYLKDELIPGHKRAKWIRSIHPNVCVKLFNWQGIDPNNSKLWAQITIKLLGFKPDKVFTSEDYGDDYAKYLEATHIKVDKQRINYPISGTKVRANPYKSWDFLEPVVKAYFTKRVVILGAESTGTTTLSKDLAKYYKTTWVPEYGRIYYEGKMYRYSSRLKWDSQEFEFIAKEQKKLEDQLAQQSNKILICDTDQFTTTLWHQRYLNSDSKVLETMAKKDNHDLYILTADDIPFIQDGTRDGEKIRHEMHQQFIDKLKRWHKKHIIVAGSYKARLKASIRAIDALF